MGLAQILELQRERAPEAFPAREPSHSARLVVTKLHPPCVRDQAVARERLFARLRSGADAKVTLVAAPAGYGKTTLLGTWREVEAASRPVAWLTLDGGDDDPLVLWSHAVAAIRRVVPGFAARGSAAGLRSPQTVDGFLPDLVNELAEVGSVALVLDDFHRLSNSATRETIAWFIDNAPSSFQLVLATRCEPALPLAGLRAHGSLLEVRADELGFTTEEAETLLNDRLDLRMDREYVHDLVERTEGWPAGLYLAGLSLRGVEDRNGFASRFGGESRHVVDFLVDEVLDAHEPEMQALMLRSSVLERLCGPLCDAVLERDGSAELLASLSRTNLFLVPLDDRGEWYRFHRVFAQLLRAELEHREPGHAPALHERAYAWHRDQGSLDTAIEHALDGGLIAEAGDLIAEACLGFADPGAEAVDDVGRGLENARRAAALEGPDSPWRATVSWALGVGHYLSGELDEADVRFRESYELAQLREAWSLAASALAFRSLVAGDQGRVEDQLRLADRSATLGRGSDSSDGEIRLATGLALASQAQLAEGLAHVNQAVDAFRLRRLPLLFALAAIRQAMLLRELGEHKRATAATAEAEEVLDRCPQPGSLLRDQVAALKRPPRPSPRMSPELSRRELVVLRMLTGPLSERDIGRELYLSHNTVHSHARSIYRKLGVTSRADAIGRGRELGLI